jgi:hypothetical protein
MTDHTYDSFSYEVGQLDPAFGTLLREHSEDNDGVLPHVFMAALARLVQSMTEGQSAPSDSVKRLGQLLEEGMLCADPQVSELVSVSFLEMLNPESRGFSILVGVLGTETKRQLFRYLGR